MLSSARQWTVADLRYDAATHTTTLPDGTDVPHVTTVLGAVRVTEDFAAIGRISRRLAEAIAIASLRGTAVHADCHAYDDDDLDWATVDERIAPYVEAWAACRRDKGLAPIARERQVYHPVHHYTGIKDGLFRLPDGRIVLGDLKTGDPESAAGHLQTAAYELAETYWGTHIDERWAIWLQPDLRIPYTIVNYSARPTAYIDAHKWLACLSVYREQPARRLVIR